MVQYSRQLDNGLRGITGEEPGILNKITGCESRTVPPLYVRVARALTKVSHWSFSGKAAPAALSPRRATHKSEDLRNALFSHIPRTYGMVRLSQKNGCGVIFGAAAYLFQEERIWKKQKKS